MITRTLYIHPLRFALTCFVSGVLLGLIIVALLHLATPRVLRAAEPGHLSCTAHEVAARSDTVWLQVRYVRGEPTTTVMP